jgi:hypothetical protein
MNYIRNHWFDMGGITAIVILVVLLFSYQRLPNYQLLMLLNLTALFLHQLEEYRWPGTFPGMLNRVMFNSDLPDRYPLNSNTSLIINVFAGWLVYLLAIIAGSSLVWMGMAAILVSLGNIVAHTVVFNLKGKTLYNAGLISCWLFFAPCVFFFFKIIHQQDLVSATDYLIGIPLGITINIFGVLKPIKWLADKDTKYIFKKEQLLPKDR